MSLVLKSIENVRCSINPGGNSFIYSVEYSFEPKRGAMISITFVNGNGIYPLSGGR